MNPQRPLTARERIERRNTYCNTNYYETKTDDDEEDEEDYRGLEKFVDNNNLRNLRTNAWDAVFDEQYEQEMDGLYDDERIAKLYTLKNKSSPELAHQLAVKDAREVQNYLWKSMGSDAVRCPKTRKMLRRMSC